MPKNDDDDDDIVVVLVVGVVVVVVVGVVVVVVVAVVVRESLERNSSGWSRPPRNWDGLLAARKPCGGLARWVQQLVQSAPGEGNSTTDLPNGPCTATDLPNGVSSASVCA